MSTSAYARSYITNDFISLVKTRGENPPKRNKAVSLTVFKKLYKHILQHSKEQFNLLVLLALETEIRRGELLAIQPESLYEYRIEVRHSIRPTSDNTSLKTPNTKCKVSINKEMDNLLRKVLIKDNGYIFNFEGFKQSKLLAELL